MEAQQLVTLIPWVAADPDGIVSLKDGGLLIGWRVTSTDMLGHSDHEAMGHRAALHHITATLGDGWWFWTTYARRSSTGYFKPRACSHPAISMVDREREAFFANGGALESDVFVWLAYFPSGITERVESWLFTSQAQKDTHRKVLLKRVREQTHAFERSLADCVTSIDRLTGNALEAALETIGSFQWVASSEDESATPFIADRFYGSSFDGSRRLLDGKPVRVVTVAAIPSTTPRTLDLVRSLPFPFLMSTRTEFISPDTARSAFKTMRANLSAKGQGLLGIWLDGAGNNLDPDAQAAMDQVEDEMSSLADGAVHCHLTISIVLCGDDADEQALEAANLLRREGLKARIEGMGTAGALLGCFPGNRTAGVRVLPLRLIHAVPFWPLAIDAGERWNEAGAFLATRRRDGTVRVFTSKLLADENATTAEHGLVVGPTEAGKSTLLATMGLSWLARPNTRVIILDKDRSCRAAVLGCGGVFRDHFGVQPLRACNERSLDWLKNALAFVEYSATSDDHKALWSALQAMKASEKPPTRTIARLLSYLGTKSLRDALAPFAAKTGTQQEGAYGALIDGVAERKSTARLQAWEMSELTESRASGLGFEALMPQIEAHFDGTPTLLLIDEAWSLLARSSLAEHVGKWLRTLRKKRVSVWLFSQSMTDVIEHPTLRDVLTQQTQRHVFLPNRGALEGIESNTGTYAAYRYMGLSDRAIHLIASAQARREYLLREGESVDVLDLCLGPLALALVGRSGIQHQEAIDRILQQSGSFDWKEWLDVTS